MFGLVGNFTEQKRLLTHSLKLWRERGGDFEAAHILKPLSDTNMQMGLYTEGIQAAKEASEIFERFGDTANQAASLIYLSSSLLIDGQPDAAEEAATHAIELLPEKGQEFDICHGHRSLHQQNRTGVYSVTSRTAAYLRVPAYVPVNALAYRRVPPRTN